MNFHENTRENLKLILFYVHELNRVSLLDSHLVYLQLSFPMNAVLEFYILLSRRQIPVN